MQLQIRKTKLIETLYQPGKYHDFGMTEIALVGRSNAGKSSLINAICQNGKLARVSSEPGKTRSINFYLVGEDGPMLVDLPGYGFAKRSGKEQQAWQRLIEDYLSTTQRLRHLFLLCDIRHEPSAGDLQMMDWMKFYRIPFTLIATKADKVAKSKRKPMAQKLAKGCEVEDWLCFSATEGIGIDELLQRIEKIFAEERSFYQTQC